MILDTALFWSFLCAFLRSSAALLSLPIFGGQTVPVRIRVMAAMALALAITPVVQPLVGVVPQDLYALAMAAGREIVMGLILGMFVTIVFAAFQIAGGFIDLQVGLGMAQAINPASGVESTLLQRFKSTLAIVVFLTMDGHHMVIRALIGTYRALPADQALHLGGLHEALLSTVGYMSLLALQIAAPVAAIGVVVDASLGFINKAIPMFPAMLAGMPAKILMGLICLSIALPAMVSGVSDAAGFAIDAMFQALRVR